MIDFALLSPQICETDFLISVADQLLKIWRVFLFWFHVLHWLHRGWVEGLALFLCFTKNFLFWFLGVSWLFFFCCVLIPLYVLLDGRVVVDNLSDITTCRSSLDYSSYPPGIQIVAVLYPSAQSARYSNLDCTISKKCSVGCPW